MKLLVTALVLLSSTAFAQVPDATDVLTAILPVGSYSGSYNNQPCKVSVKKTANGIQVTASNNSLVRVREVARGTVYFARLPGHFLSTEKLSTNDGTRENILRTIPVTENQQYVVVADHFIVNHINYELAVECVVNL
ncbi:hypothetical protein [Peredibacter starrii]|uniref:Uncharacterized protein n=1 Tax=Peredibacter starrii TaxID=28202 RepID=A0AAX4HJ18_9BACT|nr:hypothetical protein [Peredibacter starrii]WPU63223.1 hypothetical protein SOO65_11060 [Peredibacter starrii]